MDLAFESVRRLVTQVPGWQMGLFGCLTLYALWRHKVLHLLATLAFCFYLWILYQYAHLGMHSFDQQTAFGFLVGGGVLILMLMFYFMFIRTEH